MGADFVERIMAAAALAAQGCSAAPAGLTGIKARLPPSASDAGNAEEGSGMSASEIAQRHFAAALKEAAATGLDHDGLCRSLLGLIVSEYLTTRGVADVQSELRFVADNCDPDADFMFMRP
jgi:hypothetical protein